MQTSIFSTQQPEVNKFLSDNYRVLIRCRPLTKKQIDANQQNKRQIIIRKHQNTLYLYQPDSLIAMPHKFQFDKVFLESHKNIQIFKVLQESINNFMNGFNTSVMAYGQTGAGKSYTMFGNQYSSQYQQEGLISLAIKEIINKMSKNQILKMSYIQLYNQQIRDLLVQKSENLSIMEDNTKGISIPQLTEYQINDYDQFSRLIKIGTNRRAIASTSSNVLSSRSHCIIQISYIKKKERQIISSKIYFVDLAGSQRASQNKGIRLQEGGNINKSLLALGNCINCLGEHHNNNKLNFIPYRDSKLTRLLKDSLGGNAKTILIVCISPSFLSYEQTFNALKYASRALKIKKEVIANVKLIKSQQQQQIQNLKKEILRLKYLINEKQNKTTHSKLSPSPLDKKDKSLLKGSRDLSPSILNYSKMPKWRTLQKQVYCLKKTVITKDLKLMEKDEIIKNLETEINNYKKCNLQLKSPFKMPDYIEQRRQRHSYYNSGSTNNLNREKSYTKLQNKSYQFNTLQNLRQKTRQFKLTLKQVYDKYQNLQRKNKIPKNLMKIIQNLLIQYRKGNIMLSQQYIKVLFEFRNLIQLSQL